MTPPKVFGIGFQKTGTTSLAAALTKLGYKVTGPDWVDEPRIAEKVREWAFETAEQFDAFQDNPWPLLFRELDERFPESKFILTLRDTDSWIASVTRHFGTSETPMRQWIYGHGSPVGHEASYVATYEAHNSDVLRYFKGRRRDLLVMDITRGDAWEKLCPFLGRDVPNSAFPYKNRASIREQRWRRAGVVRKVWNLLGRG